MRNNKCVIVTTAIIMVIASTLLVGIISHVVYAEPQQAQPIPCITYTEGGKPIGKDCEPRANDLFLVFTGNGSLTFTQDGKPIPGDAERPAKEPRLRAEFSGGKLTKVEWVGGATGTEESIPKDANGFDFKTKGGKILHCSWSFDPGRNCRINGEEFHIAVDAGLFIDDFHFVVPESPIGIIAMIVIPLALLGYLQMHRVFQH
ncbi:hypothetical protein HRbin04_00369 [archaeon HR04]|nr:hypothetical protein HRbin04_00369 [archaeon HR04]